MTLNVKPINEAYKDQGLKILLYGAAGSGKTVACTTIPKAHKGLFISSEAGLLSIKDSTMDSVTIKTMQELKDTYAHLKDNPGEYKWVLLDSLSDIGEVLLAEEKIKATDPRQAYGVLIDEMGSIIRAFRDLPHTNIIMTAKQEKSMDDMSRTSFGSSMPGAKLATQLPYFFDFVLALRIMDDGEGSTYRAFQTQSDLQYQCKDRSGLLDTLEQPSFDALFNKVHGTKTKPKQTKQETK